MGFSRWKHSVYLQIFICGYFLLLKTLTNLQAQRAFSILILTIQRWFLFYKIASSNNNVETCSNILGVIKNFVKTYQHKWYKSPTF